MRMKEASESMNDVMENVMAIQEDQDGDPGHLARGLYTDTS
jgi:hypothetical protein